MPQCSASTTDSSKYMLLIWSSSRAGASFHSQKLGGRLSYLRS